VVVKLICRKGERFGMAFNGEFTFWDDEKP